MSNLTRVDLECQLNISYRVFFDWPCIRLCEFERKFEMVFQWKNTSFNQIWSFIVVIVSWSCIQFNWYQLIESWKIMFNSVFYNETKLQKKNRLNIFSNIVDTIIYNTDSNFGLSSSTYLVWSSNILE